MGIIKEANPHINDLIDALEETQQYKVFRRVPELPILASKENSEDPLLAIVDLETTGLNHETDEIIEIGIILVQYNVESNIPRILATYNGLQPASKPLPEVITRITGITDKDLAGQSIDWPEVSKLFFLADFVVCHNAAFDRKFIEAQSPVGKEIMDKSFACTKNDIDWQAKGYANTKLDYLNWSMGYFYDGHRAINDCWATLNIIVQSGEMARLKFESKMSYECVRLFNTPYNMSTEIKKAGFKWDPLSKSWWTLVVVREEVPSQLWNKLHYKGCKIEITDIKPQDRYSKRSPL